jgi:hypothetical protein
MDDRNEEIEPEGGGDAIKRNIEPREIRFERGGELGVIVDRFFLLKPSIKPMSNRPLIRLIWLGNSNGWPMNSCFGKIGRVCSFLP